MLKILGVFGQLRGINNRFRLTPPFISVEHVNHASIESGQKAKTKINLVIHCLLGYTKKDLWILLICHWFDKRKIIINDAMFLYWFAYYNVKSEMNQWACLFNQNRYASVKSPINIELMLWQYYVCVLLRRNWMRKRIAVLCWLQKYTSVAVIPIPIDTVSWYSLFFFLFHRLQMNALRVICIGYCVHEQKI